MMKAKESEIKNSTKDFNLTISESGNDQYILRLFITGANSRSVLAVKNLKQICEEYLKGRYELEVIDLYQNPDLALNEQIIAAPTLIKKLPLPFRRIIGDMSDIEKVLLGLDLRDIH